MDEVMFRQAYNQACNAVEGIGAPNPDKAFDATQRTLLLVLQLINDLNERIDAMHMDDD